MFIHLSFYSFIYSFILLSIQIIDPFIHQSIFLSAYIENQKSSLVSLQHGEPRLDFTGDDEDDDGDEDDDDDVDYDLSIISIYISIYSFIDLSSGVWKRVRVENYEELLAVQGRSSTQWCAVDG